jgi:hypothetical protein
MLSGQQLHESWPCCMAALLCGHFLHVKSTAEHPAIDRTCAGVDMLRPLRRHLQSTRMKATSRADLRSEPANSNQRTFSRPGWFEQPLAPLESTPQPPAVPCVNPRARDFVYQWLHVFAKQNEAD